MVRHQLDQFLVGDALRLFAALVNAVGEDDLRVENQSIEPDRSTLQCLDLFVAGQDERRCEFRLNRADTVGCRRAGTDETIAELGDENDIGHQWQ